MGFDRFLKKTLIGGPIWGHINDALDKQKKTGKTFKKCLEDSVKETVTEDLPGTSHIYQMGKSEGRKQGTVEQARRDERKMKDLKQKHDSDRYRWAENDQKKDKLIQDMAKDMYGDE